MSQEFKPPINIQQRSFQFACRIVHLHVYLCQHGGTGRVLAQQLLRSGTSIGANLEEADAGQSKADFVSKCSIALKEARETLYWLRLLTTCSLVAPHRLEPMVAEANELVAILSAIVRKARGGGGN